MSPALSSGINSMRNQSLHLSQTPSSRSGESSSLRQGQGQGAIQTVCPGSAVVGHREMLHVEIHGDFRMGIQSVHSYTSNEYYTVLISRRGRGNERLPRSTASAVRRP
jgi:hypothetical protein